MPTSNPETLQLTPQLNNNYNHQSNQVRPSFDTHSNDSHRIKSSVYSTPSATSKSLLHYNNQHQHQQQHQHHTQFYPQNQVNQFNEEFPESSCDDENMFEENLHANEFITDTIDERPSSFEKNLNYVKNEPNEESLSPSPQQQEPLTPQGSDLSLAQLINQYESTQSNALFPNQILPIISKSKSNSKNDNISRPYKCDLCTKSFVRFYLILHYRIKKQDPIFKS